MFFDGRRANSAYLKVKKSFGYKICMMLNEEEEQFKEQKRLKLPSRNSTLADLLFFTD